MSEPKPSELTVTALQDLLETAQTVAESSSSSHWQRNIIKQTENVQEHLQQLLSMLTLSGIQFLFENIEDGFDYSLNRWLQLIVVILSNSKLLSNPEEDSCVETDAIASTVIEQFSQLRNHVIETISVFKEFNNISTKVNKLHRTYKKYVISVIEHPPSLLPIPRIPNQIDQDSACVSQFSNTTPHSVSNSTVLVLTLIQQKIILEYVDDKSEMFKVILPTLDRYDDILILNALISNLDSIISTGRDGILSTAKTIRKLAPDLQDSVTTLVTALEKHSRKGRIRASVCSLDTRKRLVMLESTFQTLSKIFSDISTNLTRVVGISDYFSIKLSPKDCNQALNSNTFLRRIQTVKGIWWPFDRNKVAAFKKDAQIEAEAFLKSMLHEKNNSFRLDLPVTPELAAFILRRAEIDGCPSNEDASIINLDFSGQSQDHVDLVIEIADSLTNASDAHPDDLRPNEPDRENTDIPAR